MKLRIKDFLSGTTHLEDKLLKMSGELKQARQHLKKSREDARNSDVIKNQYKQEIAELSTHCKEYEKAIVDVC